MTVDPPGAAFVEAAEEAPGPEVWLSEASAELVVGYLQDHSARDVASGSRYPCQRLAAMLATVDTELDDEGVDVAETLMGWCEEAGAEYVFRRGGLTHRWCPLDRAIGADRVIRTLELGLWSDAEPEGDPISWVRFAESHRRPGKASRTTGTTSTCPPTGCRLWSTCSPSGWVAPTATRTRTRSAG